MFSILGTFLNLDKVKGLMDKKSMGFLEFILCIIELSWVNI